MTKMLVTYSENGQRRVGVSANGRVAALGDGALTMLAVIDVWDKWKTEVEALGKRLEGNEAIGVRLTSVTLEAPIPRPRRNPFLIAGNYKAHVAAAEAATGMALSQRRQAIFFTKPDNTVVGPTADIEYDPEVTQKVDYEIELVVVLGKRGKNIPLDQAMDYVFGYTIGNDVSARDIQVVKPSSDFTRGKGLDTFFPMGPGIVLRDDIASWGDLRMRLWVNGELRQNALPSQMTRDVPTQISELSRGLTLEAGDIIATGTPNGVIGEQPNPVWLKDGDEVVCEIEQLGRLANRVRQIG
jgi:2-keto-4-pentenoate hydratase/2-oxohepta-3-ene-1,7-dioic acid hydratase in catechol pathway